MGRIGIKLLILWLPTKTQWQFIRSLDREK